MSKKTKAENLQVFNETETKRVIEYIQNNPDMINLGLILIFACGIRVGELAALKWCDVHESPNACYISISRTETRYKDKTGRYVYDVKDSPKTDAGERDVIIPRDYIWVLKKLKAINPFTEFVFTKNSERVKADKFRKRMYRICDALNIPRRATHAIRKTYGSILLDNDLDSRLIIGQMGHTEIATTERFYHKNRRSREEKFDIISSIPEFRSTTKK